MRVRMKAIACSMRVRIQAIPAACVSAYRQYLQHACPHTGDSLQLTVLALAHACVSAYTCLVMCKHACVCPCGFTCHKALQQADILAAHVDIRALLDIGAREAVEKQNDKICHTSSRSRIVGSAKKKKR